MIRVTGFLDLERSEKAAVNSFLAGRFNDSWYPLVLKASLLIILSIQNKEGA